MHTSVHVNWERQVNRSIGGRSQFQLAAFLVQGNSCGNEEHTRVLTRLGVIQERFLHMRISKTRAFHQGLFWAAVDNAFDTLNLESHVRETLESQISEKVPRPADDWALWGVTCIPRFDG